ncbi:MAG: DUF3568 family protein [Candidatus Omnitrophica bacterium]|nr:DUF3568 family protein [Candidatus Omnitrophota bacterium]
MKKVCYRFIAVLVVLSGLSFSGCVPLMAGAAVGAGAVAYVQGVLHKNYDEPIKKLHQAVMDALKEGGQFVNEDTLNVQDSKTTGEFFDGQKFTITLNSLTEKATKLSIRVGMFGNKSRSLELLNNIEEHL